MRKTVTQRLAAFIQGVTYDGLPDEVRWKAKACILNAIGVGVAAYGTDTTRIGIAAAVAAVDRTAGGATILVNGARASLADAAFANGVMFHSRLQEDIHIGGGHVGAVAVPAALAIGEAQGASGRDFLAAVVAGYETACAVGLNNSALSTSRGFRGPVIYTIFGAAATAGKLLGLDDKGLADALGFAASMAGGTNECFLAGTSEWRYHAGMAARDGVLAALLAANGGEAAATALEGPAGFLQAFTGTNANAEAGLSGLGEKYRILDVAFKPVPVGIINQVPCMTALELAAEANLEPKDIAAIEIRTARSEANYPGAAARGPFRQISGATMSTIYCVALALSRRQVTLEGFHLFDDPTILSLMERSTLVPSDLPRLSCDIEVTTLDGRTFEKRMRRSREDFACGFDGVKGLMRSLAPEMAISSENLERLIEDVANIESCDRIDSIVELLCERE